MPSKSRRRSTEKSSSSPHTADRKPVPLKMASKAEKAAFKEGGKKGQDLAGMSDMGGVKFFSIAIDSAGGDWKLMDLVLEGMNKKVDETADDRKGGASEIGKCLMFADDKAVLIVCHVPDVLKDMINMDEWFGKIVGSIEGEAGEKVPYEGEGGGFVMRSTVGKNEAKNLFPLKMRDTAIGASFEYLVSKELVRPDDDDDDENYAEMADIEW